MVPIKALSIRNDCSKYERRVGGKGKTGRKALKMYHFFVYEKDCQDGLLTVSAREDAVSLRKKARVFG